ncbi:hypothetical protein D3C81_2112610 [compost metagenome]
MTFASPLISAPFTLKEYPAVAAKTVMDRHATENILRKINSINFLFTIDTLLDLKIFVR